MAKSLRRKIRISSDPLLRFYKVGPAFASDAFDKVDNRLFVGALISGRKRIAL
jgi:hypothetical protein